MIKCKCFCLHFFLREAKWSRSGYQAFYSISYALWLCGTAYVGIGLQSHIPSDKEDDRDH